MAKIEESECPKCPPRGAPLWVITFADMIMNITLFFILLYTFSSSDLAKYKQAVGSLKNAFGVQMKIQGPFEGSSPSPLTLESQAFKPNFVENNFQQAGGLTHEKIGHQGDPSDAQGHGPGSGPGDAEKNYEAIATQLKEKLKEENLEDEVEVTVTDRGVVVRGKGRLFFKSGSAKINKEAIPFLQKLSELQRATGYYLEIEGHTDSQPLVNGEFPSNWELSSSRANAVLRYFIFLGLNAKELRAIGYADSRPLASEGSKDFEKNRRVEFVFSEKGW